MGVKIRQKENGGKWWVFINYQGKRKSKCIGSRKAAEEVKRRIEARLVLGEFVLEDEKPPPLTFQEYAEQWLAHYVAVTCKPSSQRTIRGIVRNHLLPYFGSKDLSNVSRAHVRTFLAQKHQRYALNYVKALLRTLHTMLAQAVEEEVIDRNPASKLGRYLPEKHADPDREINPFTSTELARYLTAMQAKYPQCYHYFLCLARTGMREGEALGLTWDDIQFGTDGADPHRFIHVRRTYDPVHHMFNTPKSGRSRRVDMSQELREALLDLQNIRTDKALLQGTTTIPQVVFCGPQGHPQPPSWLYRIHRRACVHVGLRAVRVHDLRHSYATIQLYEHHAPIQYVSEQLGHSSIKITVDTYGHPRQGTSIAFADQLDQHEHLSAPYTHSNR